MGAVNLSTTPSVQLAYATHSANTIRPNGITYPDGRNFRSVDKSFAGGTLEETRHYYFTDSWQCLEERIDSSTDPERQHVGGVRYIDDLVVNSLRRSSGRSMRGEPKHFPIRYWHLILVLTFISVMLALASPNINSFRSFWLADGAAGITLVAIVVMTAIVRGISLAGTCLLFTRPKVVGRFRSPGHWLLCGQGLLTTCFIMCQLMGLNRSPWEGDPFDAGFVLIDNPEHLLMTALCFFPAAACYAMGAWSATARAWRVVFCIMIVLMAAVALWEVIPGMSFRVGPLWYVKWSRHDSIVWLCLAVVMAITPLAGTVCDKFQGDSLHHCGVGVVCASGLLWCATILHPGVAVYAS